MAEGRVVGRYVVYDEIASGGMATVHIGRLLGVVGFARTVALKRLHPHFAKDPEFVAMFLDEARIAARIRHPNVVGTIDVVALDRDLYLVMDYVQGESVANLLRALQAGGARMRPRMAATIVYEALLGLHAAHEATGDGGEPLGIVHRDVSPQNILVGVDGISRVVDFGVAKAIGRSQTTRDGQVKGKAGYMAPEQLRGGQVDRRTDVYSAAVVLWEMLAGERLFKGETPAATMTQVLEKVVSPPSAYADGIARELDELVLRGLARDPSSRFATAREMAAALERIAGREAATNIGDWVQRVAATVLVERSAYVARIESQSSAQGVPVELPAEKVKSVEEAPTLLGTATSPSVTEGTRVRRWRAWVYVSFALAVAGFAVGLVGFSFARRSAAPLSMAPAVSAPPPVASAQPSTQPASPPPSAQSAAAASAPVASSAPVRGAASRGPVRGGSGSPKPTAAAAAPDCNPPYTVDANGYHIPKPQCP